MVKSLAVPDGPHAVVYTGMIVRYEEKATSRKAFEVLLTAFVDWPDESLAMIEIDPGGSRITHAEKRVGEQFARRYAGYF